ncbi:MAG: hypothetical protein IPM92_16095 [Saprospiraceae bacterium]|nr:hypothetical protein [Saprospiraceae bacterium]
MNTNKLLLGTLAGAIVNFFAGWALYALVFKGLMESNLSDTAKSIMLPEDQHNILYYFISGLFMSLAMAIIYERWANIRTLQTGAIAGAIISVCISLGFDFQFLASTNFYSSFTMVIINAFMSALMGALTGGAIGWMLGYNRA